MKLLKSFRNEKAQTCQVTSIQRTGAVCTRTTDKPATDWISLQLQYVPRYIYWVWGRPLFYQTGDDGCSLWRETHQSFHIFTAHNVCLEIKQNYQRCKEERQGTYDVKKMKKNHTIEVDYRWLVLEESKITMTNTLKKIKGGHAKWVKDGRFQ